MKSQMESHQSLESFTSTFQSRSLVGAVCEKLGSLNSIKNVTNIITRIPKRKEKKVFLVLSSLALPFRLSSSSLDVQAKFFFPNCRVPLNTKQFFFIRFDGISSFWRRFGRKSMQRIDASKIHLFPLRSRVLHFNDNNNSSDPSDKHLSLFFRLRSLVILALVNESLFYGSFVFWWWDTDLRQNDLENLQGSTLEIDSWRSPTKRLSNVIALNY